MPTETFKLTVSAQKTYKRETVNSKQGKGSGEQARWK